MVRSDLCRAREAEVLYGRTRKEVADKLNDARRDAKRGLPLPSLRLSTGKYLTDWLEQTVKPGRKAHTAYVYEIMVRRHLIPVIGSIPLEKLTPQDVHRVMVRMAAEKLSPATSASRALFSVVH